MWLSEHTRGCGIFNSFSLYNKMVGVHSVNLPTLAALPPSLASLAPQRLYYYATEKTTNNLSAVWTSTDTAPPPTAHVYFCLPDRRIKMLISLIRIYTKIALGQLWGSAWCFSFLLFCQGFMPKKQKTKFYQVISVSLQWRAVSDAYPQGWMFNSIWDVDSSGDNSRVCTINTSTAFFMLLLLYFLLYRCLSDDTYSVSFILWFRVTRYHSGKN